MNPSATAPGKCRLDQALVERGIAPTRQKAQALILAGEVIVDDHCVDKCGTMVRAAQTIRLRAGAEPHPYVSRGGLKLAAALEAWNLDPTGKVCVDVGASTGGFTDCLLQKGAARVIALDVGYGQLDWKLRQDPRVVPIERVNIRKLDLSEWPEPVDWAVADLSFISLRLVLPVMAGLVKIGGRILALVKPQFEVGPEKVGKGGIVREAAWREEALESITAFCRDGLHWSIEDSMPCPVPGRKGNQEFWLHISKPPDGR